MVTDAVGKVDALSNEELLAKLVSLVQNERRLTQSVLIYLVEVDARKIYALHGYSSMYEYLTKALGYSDSSAYRRIQAARVLAELPSIGPKLEDGSINISQLAEIEYGMKRAANIAGDPRADVIQDLINKIEGHSIFETRKILAREFDMPVRVAEILRPQQDNSVRLEVTFSEEQMKALRKARELLSQSLPYASWSELLTFLAERQISKFEKLRGTKKDEDPSQGGAPSAPASVGGVTRCLTDEKVPSDAPVLSAPRLGRKRIAVPAALKRAVYRRANHRCEYVEPLTGRDCGSAFFLELDHIIPVALGGPNTLENLRIYCRNHNLLAAMNFGFEINHGGHRRGSSSEQTGNSH